MTNRQWLHSALPSVPEGDAKYNYYFAAKIEGVDCLLATNGARAHIITMPDPVKARMPFYAMSVAPARYMDRADWMLDNPKMPAPLDIKLVVSELSAKVAPVDAQMFILRQDERYEHILTGQVLAQNYLDEAVSGEEGWDYGTLSSGDEYRIMPLVLWNKPLGRTAWVMPMDENAGKG